MLNTEHTATIDRLESEFVFSNEREMILRRRLADVRIDQANHGDQGLLEGMIGCVGAQPAVHKSTLKGEIRNPTAALNTAVRIWSRCEKSDLSLAQNLGFSRLTRAARARVLTNCQSNQMFRFATNSGIKTEQ